MAATNRLGRAAQVLDEARAIRDEVRKAVDARFAEFAGPRADVVAAAKAVYDEVLAAVGPRLKRLEENVEGLKKLFEVGVGRVESLLKNLPVPEVNVHVPEPRLVKKHIEYDDMGRPKNIVESDVG